MHVHHEQVQPQNMSACEESGLEMWMCVHGAYFIFGSEANFVI
jgi:hypothetical protein